jgi:hypothetical protein
MPLDLTLVIICGHDPRVFGCIASVDVNIPIVVSLVPHSGLGAHLKSLGAEVTISGNGNYSISCNRGLAAVKTSRAMIVDSDCVLERGCIEHIATTLDTKPLARAAILFESSPQVFASRWTSQLRASINNRQPAPAYTPGLGLQMSIADRIGGYFFDERIFWGGDSEFSHRALRTNLEVGYDPQAVVRHAPISLWHELRSGYKLGKGNLIQARLGLRPSYESPSWLMRRLLSRMCRKAARNSTSIPIALRLLDSAWWCTYFSGYYAAMIWPPYKHGIIENEIVRLKTTQGNPDD